MEKQQVINKLFEYIDVSKDWILDEAPELFQQIIKYGIFESTFEITMCIIILFFSFWMIKKSIRATLRDDDNPVYVIGICISIILIILFSIQLFISTSYLFKATLAPKLYLLDYLKK